MDLGSIISAGSQFISKLMDGSNVQGGAGPFGDFDAEQFVGANLQKFSHTKGPINAHTILAGASQALGLSKPIQPPKIQLPSEFVNSLLGQDDSLTGGGQ